MFGFLSHGVDGESRALAAQLGLREARLATDLGMLLWLC